MAQQAGRPAPIELPDRRDVRIGCVGAGFIMADCQLVAYRNAGLNPVAISSRSESKAREVGLRHAIPTVHADWRDLVADPQVEVLDVAVPPDIQLEVVREAARFGAAAGGALPGISGGGGYICEGVLASKAAFPSTPTLRFA